MEPIKKDNEKIEEIKDIEKNEMRELSPEELEGVAGGRLGVETSVKDGGSEALLFEFSYDIWFETGVNNGGSKAGSPSKVKPGP